MTTKKHTWSFSTFGGVKRVNLETANDLLHLDQLDQKLWTALSCPVKGLEIDSKTLQLIEGVNDGQINVPDVLKAVNWILPLLKNPDALLNPKETFSIDEINTELDEGKDLYASAKIILKHLGLENTKTLTVAQTSDTEKIFAGSPFNGDGIITEDSSSDSDIVKIIQFITTNIGAAKDRGGKLGINTTHIKEFESQCIAYEQWVSLLENNVNIIKPFGEHTEAAFQIYLKLRSKIDDFYMRCNLANYDLQTEKILNINLVKVEEISTQDLSICTDQIANFPIAKVNFDNALPLTQGINPVWVSSIDSFQTLIVEPLFGKIQWLGQSQWESLNQTFAPYIEWINKKAGHQVEPLGIQEIRRLIEEKKVETLLELIAKDLEVEKDANSIIKVDQLLRYYFDLYRLLQNFVTFYDFYSDGKKAIFQNGTLYIDQRSCDLCLSVNNMARHNLMASFSGIYLIYCDCTLSGSTEKMSIVAALTNGDVDNLVIGRNALFYDRKGRAWHATISKIIENPISIRQAFWTPYRKVSRLIETQINKVASAQESKVNAAAASNVEGAHTKLVSETTAAANSPLPEAAPAAAPKAAPVPFDIGKFVGIFAAIGLALGAIGGVLASILSGFLALVWWKMPLAIIGIILAISGPSIIIAFLKLRKRNLAPLLDANGWALNAKASINTPFGNTLTHLGVLPIGSKVNLHDPFTRKKHPFVTLFFILLIIGFVTLFLLHRFGFLHWPF